MSTTLNILGYKWTPQKRVRPWALSGPILILFFCLPLLRPLRHPNPSAISDSETARLATVESIVERGTLQIDGSTYRVPRGQTIAVDGRHYARQPATMALLLSGSYWIMTRFGLSFAENAPTVAYILTLLGVTLPVAASAGLVYRMARLFELTRPYRAALGLACVIGTGLISYATVLNPHAPAAVLVLCAAGCLIHVAGTRSPRQTSPWLIVAGFCVALAGVIDLPALVFLLLFLPVIFALPWPLGMRLSGLLLYAIGTIPPLLLHAALTVPVTGDLLPGQFHIDLQQATLPQTPLPPAIEDDGDDTSVSIFTRFLRNIGRFLLALSGSHGLLSHFPILIWGGIGVFKIMHRHWPGAAKNLAGTTLAAALVIVLAAALGGTDWRQAMFATRWFVLFSPLLLFWAGAWLRKSHRPASWSLMGAALAFSVIASLIGATGAWPREGFSRDGVERYTVVEAMKNLVSQDDAAYESIAER